MKRVAILLIAVCLAACSKDTISTTGIAGRWELRAVYGGLIGFYTPYAAGNGIGYDFKSDSTFIRYEGVNKPVDNGSFRLSTKTVKPVKTGRIYFKNDTYGEDFNLRNDTLILGTSDADGIASRFVRIK